MPGSVGKAVVIPRLAELDQHVVAVKRVHEGAHARDRLHLIGKHAREEPSLRTGIERLIGAEIRRRVDRIARGRDVCNLRGEAAVVAAIEHVGRPSPRRAPVPCNTGSKASVNSTVDCPRATTASAPSNGSDAGEAVHASTLGIPGPKRFCAR